MIERATGMRAAALAMAIVLGGCATTPRRTTAPPTPAMPAIGLERVMGRPAATLVEMLGPVDLDLREGPGRKLVFKGKACVLDAYLYPPREGQEPVATYFDARLPDGGDIDRASCVAALARGKRR